MVGRCARSLDGDTFVIETTNFNAERGWRGSSEKMKLVERLTRVDADTLDNTYTVTDPETWTSAVDGIDCAARSDLPIYGVCVPRRKLQYGEHSLRRSCNGKGRDC